MPRLFPKALSTGDEVAVVAPASGNEDHASRERGIARLRGWGMKPTLLSRTDSPLDWPEGCTLSASDEQRRSDLQEAISNQRYRAIFCTRGGYGSARLLQSLDFSPLKNDPKPIVGYSDITALLTAVHRELGLAGFHGPMVATTEAMDAGEACWELQRQLLTETNHSVSLPAADSAVGLCRGEAEGVLIGGNLCILQSLLATPWQMLADDALLFIEDIGEAPYRVDRMLTQLLQAGIFDKVRGVLVGDLHFANTALASSHAPMLDVVRERLGHLDMPIAHGFPIGHQPRSWTLPTGIRAQLSVADVDATATLKLLEPAVR